MRKIWRRYKSPFLNAFFLWLFLLLINTDSMFFAGIRGDAGQRIEIGKFYLCFTEFLSLGILIFFWCGASFVVRKVRENNLLYRRGAEIFFAYFSIQMVLLVILWPGTWAWDDIMVLQYRLQFYEMFAWQQIITCIWQMTLLHIMPFPGGIVLLQQVFIAICVSVSLVILESDFGLRRIGNKFFDFLVKLFPFLMPPVLLYQYSGYRIGMLVYLELLCVVLLARTLQGKYNRKGVFILAILLAITAEWRSENILYLVLWFLALYLLKRKGMQTWICLAGAVLCLFTFITLHRIQKASMGNPYVYSISSTMRPAVVLLKKADPQRDKKEVEALEKIIDESYVREHPEANGEIVFGQTQIALRDISSNDYNDYMRALFKLAIRYPGTFLGERFSVFSDAMGIGGAVAQVTNVQHAAHLMDDSYPNDQLDFLRNSRWALTKPRFSGLRERFVLALGQQDNTGKAKVLYFVLWNGFIPLILLVGTFGVKLIKRKWIESVLIGMLLIKAGIVILAEPSPWIMYFLPQYLVGYVALSFYIVKILSNRKQERMD